MQPTVPERGCGDGDWRVERQRLEGAYLKRLGRRRPRYPPFATSSSIVQAEGHRTKEDFLEWLQLGEGWSPYVPRDPEGYYSERGEWLGWHVWLTGEPPAA